MASPVEATLLLCDAATAEPTTGKLHMLGAGWSTTTAPTLPMAVAMFLKIPWDRANQKLSLRLELLDADGQPVSAAGEPILIPAEVEAGRPPGVEPGSMLDAAYAFSIGPLPLRPGRYEWRLTFAGQVFSAFFSTR